MTNHDYMAGLFDGEGWFSIRRGKGSRVRSLREWQHSAIAGLTLREEYMIKKFQEEFGGTCTLQKNYSPKHSHYYKWHASSKATLRFVDLVGEKLILKASQAQIIKEFINLKNAQGNRPVSDETYCQYEDFFRK